jgi:hypothetical protein
METSSYLKKAMAEGRGRGGDREPGRERTGTAMAARRVRGVGVGGGGGGGGIEASPVTRWQTIQHRKRRKRKELYGAAERSL